MPILTILFMPRKGGSGSSYSIHKAKEVGSQSTKGSSTRMKVTVLQLNWVGSWRWPCGFAHCY